MVFHPIGLGKKKQVVIPSRIIPDEIPPPEGSKLKVNQVSRKQYDDLRKRYQKIPVIGHIYVQLLDVLTNAIGFAESTAARDADDMRRYDAWYVTIREADDDVRKKVEEVVTQLETQYGKAATDQAARDTSEVITKKSIRTGVPYRPKRSWTTEEGWSEWRQIVFDDLPSLPDPRKDWKKYQTKLGERLQRSLQVRARAAVDRLDRMLVFLEERRVVP